MKDKVVRQKQNISLPMSFKEQQPILTCIQKKGTIFKTYINKTHITTKLYT